jgi:hypothetical protein
MTRKEKSDYQAQLVCRELRYQLGCRPVDQDWAHTIDLVVAWMRVTGKIKYDRPIKGAK